MAQYYHAHSVVAEKCQGHMACMRNCPTEAIRVRQGKAVISEELCVDCGTCISVCKPKAIVPITDTMPDNSQPKYKVVVPSPVLYSQFDPDIHPYLIHLAFKELGFDEVVDVSTSSAAIARALVMHIGEYRGRLPLISSHCPSVLRLIQVKYPDLIELIVPFDVPREVTAREIRRTLPEKTGLRPEEISITYIAPCPAKIVSIKQPAEKERSWFDGAVSINEVYSLLFPHVVSLRKKFREEDIPKDFFFNAGWATIGSITRESEKDTWLAVSGLDHVKKIFDDIENSRLRHIEFVEAYVCMLGCVGGAFTIENPYIARHNSLIQQHRYGQAVSFAPEEIEQRFREGYYHLENPILPRPTRYFDSDLATSIKRMREIERVYQKLRQIDCGVCGSPTCRAFAEDFVRGELELTDCIFFSQDNVT
ncbi:MAG: [Fe-Fe] hydrogenase large subunit C-terminal domain-containing protein [Calditrichia bacterium]